MEELPAGVNLRLSPVFSLVRLRPRARTDCPGCISFRLNPCQRETLTLDGSGFDSYRPKPDSGGSRLTLVVGVSPN
jgi:hypothetical protein